MGIWMVFFNLGCAVFISGLCFFQSVPAGATDAPFVPGETITYDILKVGFKVGKAVLTYEGPQHVQGRDAILVTLLSKGPAFFDRETIYLDPVTFLPMRVARDVKYFGKREEIVEYYDQTKGRVRVVKTAKGETTEETIAKGHPIENIYGFIYRYRQSGGFRQGEKRAIHLPTQDVTFTLMGKEEVKAGESTMFDAYTMESTPEGYQVWFGTGAAKVPLRIDGTNGFGKTAMVMNTYHRTPAANKP